MIHCPTREGPRHGLPISGNMSDGVWLLGGSLDGVENDLRGFDSPGVVRFGEPFDVWSIPGAVRISGEDHTEVLLLGHP